MGRRWLGVGLGAIACAAVTWGALRLSSERRYQDELGRARRDMETGRYEAARGRLARLSAGWPGRAEVGYTLGVCEQELGRDDAALAAWSALPPRSPFAARAALPTA